MSWIELIAERKIKDAQERGEFEDLEGAGRPLDLSLSSDPQVPPELRAAYHVLRNAHLTPEWIELEREIDRRKQRRLALERRGARRRERDLARAAAQTDLAALAALDRARDRFLLRALEQLRELDALIERYNLLVPVVSRQRRRPSVAAALRQLAEAYPRLRPLPPDEPEPWEAALRETPPPLRLAGRLPRCHRERPRPR